METAQAAPHSGNVDKCQKALDQIIELSKLSDHEAGILLTSYIKTNGFLTDQQAHSMDGVPSVTIAGSTPKEKLQNISNKAMLFHWHINTVTKYMTDLLEVSDNETQILLGLLSDSRNHLKKLSGLVEALLQILDPNTPSTTSTKPQDVPRDDYEKKMYGWTVLDRHKDFVAMVLQEVAGFKDNTVFEGLLKALCILVMMDTLEAGPFPRMKPPGGCRSKELTTLTKTLINDSLTSYEAANGQNIQPLSPGFPDLDLNSPSPSPRERARCGLHFMGKALEEVLKDQESDLNPDHMSMHSNLNDSVTMVRMLSACLKRTIGGNCTQKPAHPEIPKHPFQRKRWSLTLLQESRDFLVWVESVVDSRIP